MKAKNQLTKQLIEDYSGKVATKLTTSITLPQKIMIRRAICSRSIEENFLKRKKLEKIFHDVLNFFQRSEK